MAYPATVVSSHPTGQIGGGAAGNLTWSHTCAAGDTVLDVYVFEGNGAVYAHDAVTYNSVALTLIDQRVDGTGVFERISLWRLVGPATGSALTISVHFLNTVDELWPMAVSVNGAATAITNIYTNTGAGANPTVTVVDSANGDVVFAALASDAGSDGPTTEGQTLLAEQEDFATGDSDFNAEKTIAVGANTVMSWTSPAVSSGGWRAIGFAVKPAGAGGALGHIGKRIWVNP